MQTENHAKTKKVIFRKIRTIPLTVFPKKADTTCVMAQKKKSKNSTLSILFWVAIILFALVIFLMNQQTISSVMQRTGFLDFMGNLFQGKSSGNSLTVTTVEPGSGAKTQETTEKPQTKQTQTLTPETKSPIEPETKPAVTETLPATEKQQPETKPVNDALPRKTRNAKLYFIKVDDDGNILNRGLPREIKYTDSPLTSTLETMLAGPTASEIEQGYITLIPTGTKLRAVRMQGTTAIIDLSEDFRFNTLGAEGYIAQLKQIVYTATEYSTVKAVQFLISGKQIEYLGAEGISITRPLDRESFP